MEFEEEQHDGIHVLKPKGRVDSRTAAEFEAKLLGLIETGSEAIAVDFAELEFMSSAGLRVILMAAKRLKANGAFALCGLSEPIMEVFQVSGFAKMLTIHDDLGAVFAAQG